jgi:beta-galactosidase/beta-glucuronidase
LIGAKASAGSSTAASVRRSTVSGSESHGRGDTPRPEYPRPQFRRSEWTNLNGEWAFALDDEDVGVAQGWHGASVEDLRAGDSPFDRRITVPFCYQSKLSGIGDTSFHDVVWYARTFERPAASAGELLLLHFGAVDYRAAVWVNGTQVALHEGGHTPFCADITPVFRDGENVLVVRAEDPSRDTTIPRGKQYWKEESEGIFYTRTTGIWQTVWLEPVGRRRIDGLRLIPDVDAAALEVEVAVEGFESGLSLRLVVTLRGGMVLDDRVELRSPLIERNLPLLARGVAPDTPHLSEWPEPALWAPEHPNLYDLRLELLDAGGDVLDAVESYFGMCKIEVRDGEVFLNDRPCYQRLVLDQGYFPGGLLTAPTDDDLRKDIELAKEMGFNGARKHQKVEDPRWLYWADVLGFLVWGEMANAYAYSPDYVRRITAEWQEVLWRDHNHPCIVAWAPMNESWGVLELASDPAQVDHLLTLYHLTRSLDRSRLVVSNDGWEHALTDLCTIHDYGGAHELLRRYATPESSVSARPARRPVYAPGYGYRGEPILISEFGGVAFSGEGGWGYTTVADAEEFLERYEALITALLQSEAVRGFCYTQLTDVEQEVNGLLTYGREPKADPVRIREITVRAAAEPRR